MTDISNWTVIDANNNGTPPAGAPEGMAPSGVNDVIRAVMGGVARFFQDTNSTLDTGGSGSAYTLTPNQTFSGYTRGDTFVIEANHTNTGAATINVSGLGAQSIVTPEGNALGPDMLTSGGVYAIYYDGTNFQLLGSQSAAAEITITSTGTVDLTDADAPLVVSPGTGQHLELDGDEIQSKSNATTAATISVNRLGGDVDLGAQSGTGDVRLHHDAVNVFNTTAIGADVLGSLLDVDNSSAGTTTRVLVRNNAGGTDLRTNTSGDGQIYQRSSADVAEDVWILMERDGAVTLHHDGTVRLSTTAAGAELTDAGAADTDFAIRNTAGGLMLRTNSSGDLRVYETNAAGVVQAVWMQASKGGQVNLNHNNNTMLQTQADGIIVGDGATSNTTVDVRGNATGTSGGQVVLQGSASEADLSIDNEAGNMRVLVNNSSEVGLQVKSGAESIMSWAGAGKIKTQDQSASDASSGGQVKDSNNQYQDIGFNVMPKIDVTTTVTTPGPFTQARIGTLLRHASGTAHTWAVANVAAIPVYSAWTITNGTNVDGGIVTLDCDAGVTIRVQRGGTVEVTSDGGTVELLDGAAATLYKMADAVYMLWGAGIGTVT
jgi:hypothetical protein